MESRKRLVSGALLLASGQFACQLCVFLRNLVVVRTLTKTDYGIAATFALTLVLLESSSHLGVEKILVHARDGNDRRFQRAAQLLRFVQGVLMSALLMVMAPAFAAVYDVPEAEWGYRVLAVVPLVNGLIHLDVARFQRRIRYGPQVLAEVSGQVTSLVVVCVLASFVQDYTLVLAAVISQPVMMTVISHVRARRRYGWGRDRGFLVRCLSFGWPLMINGVLVFVVGQGDRFLIGSCRAVQDFIDSIGLGRVDGAAVYFKDDLATFALAASLTAMPSVFAAGVGGALVFPVLARVQDDRDVFARRFRVGLAVFAVFAAMVAVGFVIAGGAVSVLIYSERYRAVETVIAWIGLAQAQRIIRIGMGGACLALGDSRTPMTANVIRANGFVGALVTTVAGGPLLWIALSAAAGEVLALATMLFVLQRKHGVAVTVIASPLVFFAVSVVIALGVSFALGDAGDWMRIGAASAVLALTVLAARWCYPDIMRLKRWRSPG